MDFSFGNSIALACGTVAFERDRLSSPNRRRAAATEEFKQLAKIDRKLNPEVAIPEDDMNVDYWKEEEKRTSVDIDEASPKTSYTQYVIFDELYKAYVRSRTKHTPHESDIEILNSLNNLRLYYATLFRTSCEQSKNVSLQELGAITFLKALTKSSEFERKAKARYYFQKYDFQQTAVTLELAAEQMDIAETYITSLTSTRTANVEMEFARCLNERAFIHGEVFRLVNDPAVKRRLPFEYLKLTHGILALRDWEGNAMHTWDATIAKLAAIKAELEASGLSTAEFETLREELLLNRSTFAEYAADITLTLSGIPFVPIRARSYALQRIINLYSVAMLDQREVKLANRYIDTAKSAELTTRERILEKKQNIVFKLASSREDYPTLIHQLKGEHADTKSEITKTKTPKMMKKRNIRLDNIWSALNPQTKKKSVKSAKKNAVKK